MFGAVLFESAPAGAGAYAASELGPDAAEPRSSATETFLTFLLLNNLGAFNLFKFAFAAKSAKNLACVWPSRTGGPEGGPGMLCDSGRLDSEMPMARGLLSDAAARAARDRDGGCPLLAVPA